MKLSFKFFQLHHQPARVIAASPKSTVLDPEIQAKVVQMSYQEVVA